MRRATAEDRQAGPQAVISIHALHEESDVHGVELLQRDVVISIHALHEESDPAGPAGARRTPGFQSTLSMRRATDRGAQGQARPHISIHALHEESDRRPDNQ